MKFKYSVIDPSQNEFDSLPRVTLSLSYSSRQVDVSGLVDSGATISVLPYQIGIRLGEMWDDRKAYIRLAGNLGKFMGIPLAVKARIGDFDPVRLAFAWVKTDNIPLILGQTNFFMEFDVCFYRSKLEFEIRQKSP
ncbi:MAG: hypothetical protein AB7S75_00960 [Desulfococcaceae bacterium]